MAAPTQEFPPWLTPIPSVIFDGNGVPITTSTTIMFLPLTYFGPSIPLGPDWTYGGLTSPAATSTTSSPSMTPTAIPSSFTTAIPSSSSSSLLTSVSSSSSSISTNFPSSTNPVTSPSISPSITTTLPATPTTPSPTASVAAAAGRLTRGQLVGVIVASILGFIFLLVLFLAFYLFCKGKKRRRAARPGAGGSGRSIDDDYISVPAGGRLPGEGSPRQSGEEADPFLRPPGGGGGRGEKGTGGGRGYAEMGARPPVPPKNVQRIPPPPATIPSLSSNNSSSTGSGYGEPLAQPTLGIRPIREEHEQEMVGGRVLTPEEMQRLGQESVLPHDSSDPEAGDRYSGAYAYTDVPNLPPPKLVAAAPRSTPDYTLPRIPPPKRPSQASHRSSLPLDVDENATLLTARRVRVEDLGPRSSPGSSPIEESSKSHPSSFLGTLGAIAGKMSWRKSQSPRSSQQQQQQRQPLLESTPLSLDRDIEQGHIPPTPQMREPTTASSRGGLSIGLGPDGARPLSSVSGRSQNSAGTIYHDALSSIPSMPSIHTPLTPLPRVITPSDVAPSVPFLGTQRPTTPAATAPQVPGPHHTPLAGGDGDGDGEHVKNVHHHPSSPGGTSYAHTLVPSDFDILDMPAPSAISLFSGASVASLKPSMGSDATAVNNNNNNHAAVTGAGADPSLGTLRGPYPLLPPGLELIPTPKTWAEISPGETPSPGSFGGDQENGVGVGIMIDILEEEPPTAGENWRTMAGATATSGSGGDDEVENERLARRTTFGLPQYVHQPDFTSEQASLYSMRSHLSPTSPPRSTGSAPVSTRRDPSYGSNSSRPSAGGCSSGAISYAQSLARTGSITSDGRRRGFGTGPISPALSVFGHNQMRSGSGAASREGSHSASGSGEGSSTGGTGGGVVLQSPSTAYLAPMRNASNTSSSPPLSPLSMPWAAGLDDSWNASG